MLDAFRIEYILHSFQRKELSLNLDVTWSLFVGDIFKTANKAQLQFKDLLAFDRNYAELPREAALKAFQQSCSKKAFIHIYERLKAGDGQMRIKSSEGFIYRNLSKLIDDGIICKGYSQSEYILMIKFRMLIHDDSTLNEYIKAHHSQYSTEQNSIN